MNGKRENLPHGPWSIAKTLKYFVCFCVIFGLILLAGGIALLNEAKSVLQIKTMWFAVVPVVFGLSFLALSAAVAFHLRLRSDLSRTIVRVCCVLASLCAVPASFALMPAGQGRYVVAAVWIVPAHAYVVYALIEKRLERGDESPLVAIPPGMEGPIRWRKILLIYALAALVAMAVSAIANAMAPGGGRAAGEAEAQAAAAARAAAEAQAEAEARWGPMNWEDVFDLPPFPSHLFNPGEGGSE